MSASALPETGTIVDAEAVTLFADDRGTGSPVVLLHGFPDTWRTWDELADALVAAGHRVVMPALRGYAPSGVPADGDYSLAALACDVVAVLDALDIERAVVVGHDWGASAGYALAALHPDRVERLVALAIPPLAVFPCGWRERLARPHNLYLGLGAPSAAWLGHRNLAEIDRLYRLWSPRWRVPIEHLTRVRAALAPAERTRAAVDYYRLGVHRPDAPEMAVSVVTPVLMLYGEDEPAVRCEAFGRALAVVGPGSETVCLPGVGHWPHLEAPDACHDRILAFLFPAFRGLTRLEAKVPDEDLYRPLGSLPPLLLSGRGVRLANAGGG